MRVHIRITLSYSAESLGACQRPLLNDTLLPHDVFHDPQLSLHYFSFILLDGPKQPCDGHPRSKQQ